MLRTIRNLAIAVAVIVALLIGWKVLLGLFLIACGAYLWEKRAQRRATARFRRDWHPQGKDLLLVYSNSPHWQRYVEQHWLPKWGARAVVLNWSERKTWALGGSSEAELFRVFGGANEFNPLGIVVPSVGAVRVVRFWRAFRDFKHGKGQPLRDAEIELALALDAVGGTIQPALPSGSGPPGSAGSGSPFRPAL
jgi:hypothetical protein